MNAEKFLTKTKVVALAAAFSLTISMNASSPETTKAWNNYAPGAAADYIGRVHGGATLDTLISFLSQWTLDYLEGLAQKNGFYPTVPKHTGKVARRFVYARYGSLPIVDKATMKKDNKDVEIINYCAHAKNFCHELVRANSHDWAYKHDFNVGTPAESIHKSVQYHFDVAPPAVTYLGQGNQSLATALFEGLDSKCWNEVMNNVWDMNFMAALSTLKNNFDLENATATFLAKFVTACTLSYVISNLNNFNFDGATEADWYTSYTEFNKGLLENGVTAGVNYLGLDLLKTFLKSYPVHFIKTQFS